jgi:hypothetical protein
MTDISDFGFANDVEFTRHLIREIGVAVVPGSSFYRKRRRRPNGPILLLQIGRDARGGRRAIIQNALGDCSKSDLDGVSIIENEVCPEIQPIHIFRATNLVKDLIAI